MKKLLCLLSLLVLFTTFSFSQRKAIEERYSKNDKFKVLESSEQIFKMQYEEFGKNLTTTFVFKNTQLITIVVDVDSGLYKDCENHLISLRYAYNKMYKSWIFLEHPTIGYIIWDYNMKIWRIHLYSAV